MVSSMRKKPGRVMTTPLPCLRPNPSPSPTSLSIARLAFPPPHPTTLLLLAPGQTQRRAVSARTIHLYSHSLSPPVVFLPYTQTVSSNHRHLCRLSGIYAVIPSAPPRARLDSEAAQQ